MANKNTTEWKEFKAQILNDSAAKAAYDAAERAWKLKELLIEAREHANLSQAQLARKLDLAPSNLNRIEKSPEYANMQTIFKYLDACNVKIDFNLSF